MSVSKPHEGVWPPAKAGPADLVPSPTVSGPDDPTVRPGSADLDATLAFVPAAPSPSRSPGTQTFGDYELLNEIARGGMGVVYKARQRKLNRTVALKMILAGQFATEEAVKRFYAEAEAAARLDHSGIVSIYEVGQQHGQHFMALAFVDGQSLWQRVKEAPLEPREAARLMRQVAEAVHFAHQQGIIHRDLKPQNILLTKDGQPRVTDFGLAKRQATDSSLTATGQVMGTPSYMSPEQAEGKTADIGPAADIYSLGATLYCLLTGRPPFQAATTLDTLFQVLKQEPLSPRQLNPAIPRDLETICLKCLRKEPDKRYATAAELSADLERWLEHKPIVARPVGPGERAWLWCKRRPTVAAAIIVTVVALVGSGMALATMRNAAAIRQAETMVESHLIAPAAGVPYTLQQLKPLHGYATHLLHAKLTDESTDALQRLHAAYGLSELGEAQQAFLLDAIPAAPGAECPNIVAALQSVKSSALFELTERSAKATESLVKFRYAIVALQLGDPRPVQALLALRPDPIDRTTLIHAFADWHGDLTVVAESLLLHKDSAFRSGLCAALGTIPWESMPVSVRDTVSRCLVELYIESPDGGTHSAAGWALRQWKQNLPAISATAEPPTGRRWHVNGQGITMLAMPTGKITLTKSDPRTGQPVPMETTISRSFLLADCETTGEQFTRFMDDADYPAAEKPVGWKAAYEQSKGFSPEPNGPVISVNWFDAVLYCNWLSLKERIHPAYERTGEKWKWKDYQHQDQEADAWRCDFKSPGYRLPTETEWEYACRAMTASAYCFGDDEDQITHYGWVVNNSKNHAWSGAQKRSNSWGLFDMHGNLCEWCDDLYKPSEVTENNASRVLRGGAFLNEASLAASALRSFYLPGFRANSYGFRPARTYAAATPDD